jgi:hypothetical protein
MRYKWSTGAIRMAYYRLYYLDSAARILRVEEIETDSDDEAMRHAASLDHPHGIEVWQQRRKVGLCRAVAATGESC